MALVDVRRRRAAVGLRVLLAALLALAALAGAQGAARAASAAASPTGAQASGHAAGAPRGGPPVDVMTRNLYLGADLTPLFAATGPAELVAATTATWQAVLAADFPERAAALAEEVADHRPLVIGLQEVSLWRTSDVPGQPAETVALDYLELFLDALAARGLHYEAASVAQAFDGQLTAFGGPLGLFDVRLTDRDAILVRTDVPASQLEVVGEQHGRFEAALELPILGQPLRLDRTWNAIDVRVRNRTLRIVNTHLEAFDPGEVVRDAQARELLAGPLATELPVVLLGDINSHADGGVAYGTLTEAGFADAWAVANPGADGFTCCQPPDLRNPTSQLARRIDVVLLRGGLRARDAELVGARADERTPSGLWPSDHAGVVARLMVLAR